VVWEADVGLVGSGAIGLIVGVVVPIAMLEALVESYRFAKKVD